MRSANRVRDPAGRDTFRAMFTGFSKSAPGFFHELGMEMNRDWFLENKARYEAEWVQPMHALLAQVRDGLASAYKPQKLAEPKVMRIHRDVRFSKDKTPYKTHIGAVLRVAGKDESPAAMYLHLGSEEEFVGGGIYFFDAAGLAKWRKLVAGKGGEEVAKMIAKLRKAGYEVGGHDDYKKVPRGFDPEHPRADLLKMKGLTAGPGEIPRGLLHKPGLADWLVEHGRAMAPLVRWLHTKIS